MKERVFLKAVIIYSILLFFPLNGAKVMSGSGVERLLPQSSEVNGWQLMGNHYNYLPANLYNYINGAADLFISYGFVELVGAEYTPGSGKKENMIVDIYDMGNKLNAFGVFQSKRDPESKSLKIGGGAFGSEKYVFFYKDRFHVEIQAFFLGAESNDIVTKMAKKVANGIAGDCTPPSELNYLPDANRIPGSEVYITGGILGHAFLDRGLVSDYKISGEVVKVFVAFFSSRDRAVNALNQYKSYLDASGEKWQVLNRFGEIGFVSKEPYHKNIIVAQQGHFVVGVADLSRAQKGEELLNNVIREIKKSI